MNIAMDLIREALLGGSGGGGGGGEKLILSDTLTISTTNTSAVLEKEWDVTDMIDMLEPVWFYAKIRDKAGLRDGYFGGSDYIICNKGAMLGNNTYGLGANARWGARMTGGSLYNVNQTTGVYADWSIAASSRKFRVYSKYGSGTSSTVDGEFTVELYKIPAIGGKLY